MNLRSYLLINMREELNFEIIDVGEPEVAEGEDNDFQIKSLVAKQKQDALHKYLSEINSKDWVNANGTNSFEEFLSTSSENANSGLIFCPHRTSGFGVKGAFGGDIRIRVFKGIIWNVFRW